MNGKQKEMFLNSLDIVETTPEDILEVMYDSFTLDEKGSFALRVPHQVYKDIPVDIQVQAISLLTSININYSNLKNVPFYIWSNRVYSLERYNIYKESHILEDWLLLMVERFVFNRRDVNVKQ